MHCFSLTMCFCSICWVSCLTTRTIRPCGVGTPLHHSTDEFPHSFQWSRTSPNALSRLDLFSCAAENHICWCKTTVADTIDITDTNFFIFVFFCLCFTFWTLNSLFVLGSWRMSDNIFKQRFRKSLLLLSGLVFLSGKERDKIRHFSSTDATRNNLCAKRQRSCLFVYYIMQL